MAQNKLVIAGPKLQRALHDLVGTSPKTDLTAAHTPQKVQSVITRMGGESKSHSYNGYFTLKDVSTYNEDGTVKEFRVAVCDGETWDEEKETSGNMPVYVNDFEIKMESCIFTRPAETIHISLAVIKKDANIEGLSISKLYPISSKDNDYRLCFLMHDSYIGGLQSYSVYLLGDIEKNYNKTNIIQRHMIGIGNGIPRLWMSQMVCKMEVQEDDTDANNKG